MHLGILVRTLDIVLGTQLRWTSVDDVIND
jgi:hypothetical protein